MCSPFYQTVDGSPVPEGAVNLHVRFLSMDKAVVEREGESGSGSGGGSSGANAAELWQSYDNSNSAAKVGSDASKDNGSVNIPDLWEQQRQQRAAEDPVCKLDDSLMINKEHCYPDPKNPFKQSPRQEPIPPQIQLPPDQKPKELPITNPWPGMSRLPDWDHRATPEQIRRATEREDLLRRVRLNR